MSVPGSRLAGQGGSPSQHVAVQRRVMVFLGLVHMLMTVLNLVFLFMRPPLIPFGFCSSYQLLIRFSAHGRGGRQVRRQGAEGESKRCREGGKAKGGGEGNRRKAPMSVAGREYDCERRTTCLCRASAGGSSRSFRIHERAVPPESRGARRAHAAAAAGCRNQAPASNLRKWETTGEGGELGDAHQRLTLCSPCSPCSRGGGC
jgi:hypothetical protein